MNMKRQLAIAVMALGGFVIFFGVLIAISKYAGGLYEDVHVFELDLRTASQPLQTTSFTRVDKREFSLWLKVPTREIENKQIELDVVLIREDGIKQASFRGDFALGALRNSTAKGQYYRLGAHSFDKGFSGAFRYQTKGRWVPPYNGKLVLRQSLTTSIPIREAGFIIMGIVLVFVGLSMIKKQQIIHLG